MGNHLARHTTRRSRHQAKVLTTVADYMKTYDVSKTGSLSREEVRTLAEDLCNVYTPLVGGIREADVDMIMMCGGENTSKSISAKELPLALAVMMAVREDNQCFHELFVKHDTDRTGLLPADQLASLLAEINDGQVPGPRDLEYILRQCEPRGKNDPIPESQVKCAIACWYCLCQPAHEKIKAMFQAWDTDRTGVISKDELAAVVKGLSPEKVSDAEIDALFNSIDTHNTGTIEYDEFVEWVLGGGVPIGAGVQDADYGKAVSQQSSSGPPDNNVKWSTGWLKNR